ncbi:MAG TPA: DNA polymerase III subunit beta [Candidatus Dependentiae bacterium]|nr:DNA polymerase III subunit beta [Candidatus Dependentiae bacterium]HRQ62471.1 DNA polymerase III subunit beta [Candidatus Dependentiae bacterium]
MKNTFIVEQKPFLSLLASMQPICTKRTTLDATSSILFQIGHKELVLKSTDLEISLQASYQLEHADIMQPQSFLVSGRRVFDLIKELDGQIEITVTDKQMRLKSGSAKLALNIKDAQDFPPFPERIENLMHLDQNFLLDMLNKVAFLIPQNNATPALNGLYLEISRQNLKMTTTDGHCLAQVCSEKYQLEEPKTWLLPRRAVFEVKKLLEGTAESKPIFLGVCGNQLVFSGESFNFFTKLLVDPFPQYQNILERKGFVPAKVDRSHFVKTLKRSSCLLSGQFIATTFGFDPEKIHVSMQNNEVGALQEDVPLEGFTGEQLDVRFYAPYLLSGLQVFPQDQIQFYLKNASKPIIFESADKEYNMLYLVMPVAPTHAT